MPHKRYVGREKLKESLTSGGPFQEFVNIHDWATLFRSRPANEIKGIIDDPAARDDFGMVAQDS